MNPVPQAITPTPEAITQRQTPRPEAGGVSRATLQPAGTRLDGGALLPDLPDPLQGYLAHKKTHPP